jgi:hypothetical protein
MDVMETSEAVQTLERELRLIFGSRLRALVMYGLHRHASVAGHDDHASHTHDAPPTHTLAVVDMLTGDDLRGCAAQVSAWHDAGLATPLILAAHEFECSLDAFPFEFGAILADHVVVSGDNPFAGLAVDVADWRRACEVQARSHLLHLREGYIETRARTDALAVLIVRSAPPLASLVQAITRLEGHASADVAAAARQAERTLGLQGTVISEIVRLAGAKEMSSADAERLFPPYLDAVERLVKYVDGWTAA